MLLMDNEGVQPFLPHFAPGIITSIVMERDRSSVWYHGSHLQVAHTQSRTHTQVLIVMICSVCLKALVTTMAAFLHVENATSVNN